MEKIKQELDSQFKYNQNIIESLKKNNKKATNSEVYNSSSDSQFQILKKMIDNLVNSIPDRLPMIIQHLSQKIKKLEDTKFNSTKISLINSEANALKNKVQDMDKHLALLENMNHQNRNKNKDKHQILAMTNRNSNSDKKYYSTKLSNKDKISVKNNGKFPSESFEYQFDSDLKENRSFQANESISNTNTFWKDDWNDTNDLKEEFT